MTAERYTLTDPRIVGAVHELKLLIAERYPEASFEVSEGEDPDGIYVAAIVDLDDATPVLEAVRERLLQYQVEEQLPVFVVPLRPIARVLSELEPRRRRFTPMMDVGVHPTAP